MNEIYADLFDIKKDPSSVLRNKSLKELNVFWYASWTSLSLSSRKAGCTVPDIYREFEIYVEEYYETNGWGTSKGWMGLIYQRTKDEDQAFTIFFQLLDQFLLKKHGKILEEIVDFNEETNKITFYYDILNELKKRPGMFLFEKNFSRLWAFCYGYELGGKKFAPEIKLLHENFQKYVNNRFGLLNADEAWDRVIIEKTSDDDEAFKVFFELLDEFLIETTGKNLEENAMD